MRRAKKIRKKRGNRRHKFDLLGVITENMKSQNAWKPAKDLIAYSF